MPDRLSALDASFLYVDDPGTPMHVGSVAVFDRPGRGFGFDQVLALIRQRLAYLPRYRQRVVAVPGRLARPVWVDDVDFDLNYHVRRSALPVPGDDGQLFDLVARLLSRRLAPERPLWESYFVEGLSGGRVALVSKTHQSVVDGVGTIELGQLILDPVPNEPDDAVDTWVPRRQPNRSELVLDAVTDTVRRPGELLENARNAANDVSAATRKAFGVAGALMSALSKPASPRPLNVRVSGGRVFAVARTKLADYRAIRARHGVTVNDVVLAVITGALREWLLSRGEQPTGETTLRALVPLAVREDGQTSAELVGNRVRAFLVDLPVGEPDPVLRLQHVGHVMAGHQAAGRPLAARALLRAGGFAPATLHSLGARAAGSLSDRIFNLVITNSPGPQRPLYAGSARMREMFPVIPLARNQALAIGVTSYHGGVYFGLNGDRKAVSDVDTLSGMIEDSLAELMDVGPAAGTETGSGVTTI